MKFQKILQFVIKNVIFPYIIDCKRGGEEGLQDYTFLGPKILSYHLSYTNSESHKNKK